MSDLALQYVVHKGPDTPAHGAPLLVLMHGYGSDEQDMIGLVPSLDSRLFCVSVRAPHRLDFGGFAWFNIERGPEGIRFDFTEALESLEQVFALIAVLQAEYRFASVFIAGFSQGASMALAAALKRPRIFAGVLAMSGVCGPEILPDDPALLRGLQVFISHGRQDSIIPIAQARASKDLLDPLGLDLSYTEYDMPHGINAQCLEDVDAWLKERLNEG